MTNHDNDISKQLQGQIVLMPSTGSKQTVTTGDLAYLAGFFDGEGCVQIRKRGRRWEAQLRFINTSYPIMRWIANVTGGSLSKRKAYGLNSRRSFEVCLQHNRAEIWARLLRPYLRIKADEIDLLLEFRKSIKENRRQALSYAVDEYRQELVEICSILKRRTY